MNSLFLTRVSWATLSRGGGRWFLSGWSCSNGPIPASFTGAPQSSPLGEVELSSNSWSPVERDDVTHSSPRLLIVPRLSSTSRSSTEEGPWCSSSSLSSSSRMGDDDDAFPKLLRRGLGFGCVGGRRGLQCMNSQQRWLLRFSSGTAFFQKSNFSTFGHRYWLRWSGLCLEKPFSDIRSSATFSEQVPFRFLETWGNPVRNL